ncbi:hypothetical protein [Acaryochloris sp. IP29b_bin.148]|uniref:hypothetical protein n=1 Tax=Acaryochloris sp. IP29b_bin.148 TaxID=2969218 RepID=UPI00262E3459|nr:hypothetical protein [Acaryochloris sp. IP29b_bin.148]
MPSPYYSKEQIKSMVELKRPDLLYQIKDEYGDVLDFSSASGRELLNHLRHNVTNYDDVLQEIEHNQGSMSGRQLKHATNAATELVLALYRDEHVRVIQVAQDRGNVLRNLMKKVGVSSASALSNLLDSWSEKLKTVAKLENSQRSLQQWNDTYRVQRTLVKKVLEHEGVDPSIRTKVDQIYSTRSVNKAIAIGESLLDWEQSEILKLVKKAIRYKHLSGSENEKS